MKSCSQQRRRQARSGMVLLEVVAALTIFGLVAFALVMALDSAMDVALARNKIAAATQGIENQMAVLRGSRVVSADKDLPDDGSGITYHLSVQPESLKDEKGNPVPNIYRATITAKWKLNGTPEDRSVSFLLNQP